MLLCYYFLHNKIFPLRSTYTHAYTENIFSSILSTSVGSVNDEKLLNQFVLWGRVEWKMKETYIYILIYHLICFKQTTTTIQLMFFYTKNVW